VLLLFKHFIEEAGFNLAFSNQTGGYWADG